MIWGNFFNCGMLCLDNFSVIGGLFNVGVIVGDGIFNVDLDNVVVGLVCSGVG